MRPAELHTEFKLSSRVLGHTICNKNTLPAQPYTFLCNRNLQRSLCVRQNYTQNSNCPAEFWDIQSATRTHYRLSHIHSYAIEICREVYASGRTTHRIQTVQQNSGTYNLQQEHTTGSAIYILMQQRSVQHDCCEGILWKKYHQHKHASIIRVRGVASSQHTSNLNKFEQTQA